MRRNSFGSSAKAFSLLELLIVVAIISVLMSILLPAMGRAREQAKQVYCKNNLRSIWTGIYTYTLEFKDRVPYMTNPNGTKPDVDPFENDDPTSVGRVLLKYVNPKSWVCPDAVAGYPRNAGSGSWKMTYSFSTADMWANPVAYDKHPQAYTGGLLDPAMSNYYHFDGRPIRLLDGRRYVSHGKNTNSKGTWNSRFPVVFDMLGGDPLAGAPEYPHVGLLDARDDLENHRDEFYKTSFGTGTKTGYFELHADKDRVDMFLTRHWQPHQPGF